MASLRIEPDDFDNSHDRRPTIEEAVEGPSGLFQSSTAELTSGHAFDFRNPSPLLEDLMGRMPPEMILRPGTCI
jgi:hypothetical protein